ncbi:Na+/H+ antiporter subunit A [Amnibacterium kyonggiense]|uniref:Multisubunit sodium/proton antiporter MrpA subunit /multisubunit sodium/proton antiporter MrpB subunit n=1 Tax=Amnibacterium kyonggiense TaxID=595671 RepID=A0A4R7FMI2_9MICO|nr:Na+/H+ antiporter subunit A [Amnibacterium kyonggiense]TDS77681.1 multisubunit sodium/proton antiporter MrpA subunit /multisubunit sodium/proton antiporter MrpB subunit [Amnibacterium kyonggiense]
MFLLLLLFGLTALALPLLTPRLGTKAFLVAAVPPTLAFAVTLARSGDALHGGVRERTSWVPQLGLALDLRLDPLSWTLALVVTGVGALVLLYCVSYFHDDEPSLGRFAATFTAFAGAMYGLVVADDVYLLFTFWELTSVLSYLLIGHYSDRRASRGAALQALLVTTLGGLAMLAGLVLLQQASGTSTLSGLVAAPPPLSDPVVIVGVALVLLGAITKSAVFPFHFWLPGAMAAPTPVSAYLHAAAMVKAGVYLVLRLAPGFAAAPGWREALVSLGVVTMLIGGARALREHDLKLVLAGGTVAQLGFLTIVASLGTAASETAALALLVGHALFKSTLFLVTGVVDHAVGTRDLRRISGLGRRLPVLAAVAAVAAASMAGVPPTLGFVTKEGALIALGEGPQPWGAVAVAGVVIGSVLTVAYALRFVWGAFATKRGVVQTEVDPERIAFLAPPAVLAAASLLLGPLAGLVVEPAAEAAAHGMAGEPVHLVLWHGPTLELLLSGVTLAGGIGLFLLRDRLTGVQEALHPRRSAEDVYRGTLRGIDVVATRTTATIQTGSLARYVAVILTVFAGGVGAVLLSTGILAAPRLFAPAAQIVTAALMAVAAIAATVAGKRFQAVVLTGVTGLGMAVLFGLQGAPDLALTQVLVDLVTLIAFVLVLRRLPARLGVAHASTRPVIRILLGVAVAGVMVAVVLTTLAARTATPVSEAFERLAVEIGHGNNVVNVTLVDIRGWDTFGEITVLVAAATGVASLVFVGGRSDRLPALRGHRRRAFRRTRPIDPEVTSGTWLLAGRTLRPEHRSILLEVAVRLTFHATIVVSVYLLFAGHNDPGGGFAGGLVAGLALTGRYLAAGRYELGLAAPLNAGVLLGLGLVLAVGTAVVPLAFGEAALTSHYLGADLGWFGKVSFSTSAIFDIGVYLIVVGVVLDVLRSLGGELDREYEAASAEEVRA